MREQLVRYLLGELDAAEQSQLEKQLRESSELRRELAYLQACFANGRDACCDPAEPPRGLAERTTERVACCDDYNESPAGMGQIDFATGRAAAFAGAPDPPASSLGWSLADISVAAGVCLAISMLLAPALRNSRDASQRTACMNNLQATYLVVKAYANQNGGRLPSPQRHEYAGMFIVRLIAEDYVGVEEARKLLACSGSPLGEAIRNGSAEIFIPSSIQIRSVRGDSLASLFRTSTGSYSVPLPSIQPNGEYRCPNLFESDQIPIMADAPNYDVADNKSLNHFNGLNVLYSDGQVKFQTVSIAPRWNDRLFVNDLGEPAAGRGVHDAVLVTGEMTPGIDLMGEARPTE
jgi:hypothetical protein